MNTQIRFHFILLMVLCSSCSNLVKKFSAPDKVLKELEDYKLYQLNDYSDQLNSLQQIIENDEEFEIVKLSSQAQTYLTSKIEDIVKNNELLFDKSFSAKVYIIRSNIPFYFSLPNGGLFFSLDLFKNYIPYESLLMAVLTFESLRSKKAFYNKHLIFPTGQISLAEILKLSRLSLKNKLEINKWALYALKRAGFEGNAYLSWLQVMNKNTSRFILHLGSKENISREETLLKRFIAKHGLKRVFSKRERNSSQSFYEFLKEIKRI